MTACDAAGLLPMDESGLSTVPRSSTAMGAGRGRGPVCVDLRDRDVRAEGERGPALVEDELADIELRAVPSLWPIRDLAPSGPWDFSIVRFMNARPR